MNKTVFVRFRIAAQFGLFRPFLSEFPIPAQIRLFRPYLSYLPERLSHRGLPWIPEFQDHFHYRQLAVDEMKNTVDFRCLRFPGLISSITVPTGGTSDYGPEMLHAAAQGKPYRCFVRPDTRLPFMVMPDAIKSLLQLAEAPREGLKQLVYNVTSFSPTAEDFYHHVKQAFPEAVVTFEPHAARQKIVDSWPADVDDSAAARDWGWKPDFDENRAFEEYLIPSIKTRHA